MLRYKHDDKKNAEWVRWTLAKKIKNSVTEKKTRKTFLFSYIYQKSVEIKTNSNHVF